MYYSYPQIVFKEVPGEISLALSISGCSLQCKECHSIETWDSKFGEELTASVLHDLINKNKGITCVLFYGGEWDLETLSAMFSVAHKVGLKIALYTGRELEYFSTDIFDSIDYIKTGPYIKELGGLGVECSNQVLYKIINKTLTKIL